MNFNNLIKKYYTTLFNNPQITTIIKPNVDTQNIDTYKNDIMIQVNNDCEFKNFDIIDYSLIFKNKNTYDFIYVSIGSKINVDDSNAKFQMFPTFLYKKKSLIIIIDDFNEKYEENKSVIIYHKNNYDFDIFIINKRFDDDFEDIFIKIINNLKDIDKNKIIIASYLRFVNNDETYFEKKYNEILSKFNVNNNNFFSEIFYIWCGYGMFCNIITKYVKYKFFITKYVSQNNPLIDSCLPIQNKPCIDCKQITQIYNCIYDNFFNGLELNDDKVKKNQIDSFSNLFIFFKNSIDICCDNNEKIYLSYDNDDNKIDNKINFMKSIIQQLKGGNRKRKSSKTKNKTKRNNKKSHKK